MKDIALLSWTHWLIIALSVALTLSAWLITKNQTKIQQTSHFNQEVLSIENLLNLRLEKYEDILWAGVATIQAQTQGLNYREWQKFTNPLNLTEKYNGINGIGVIYHVPKDQIEQFISQQKEDRPDFTVHPRHNETEFFPITFIEPVEPNKEAVGLDMAHEKSRYTAIKIARRTGLPTLTGPIKLVQDKHKNPAFLFFAPFYKNTSNKMHMTEDERMQNFVGVVYAPFTFKQLIGDLFQHRGLYTLIRISDGNTFLYDEKVPLPDNVIATLKSKPSLKNRRNIAEETTSKIVEFAKSLNNTTK